MNKKEQLNQYFDGELTDEEKAVLLESIECDAELGKHLTGLKELSNLHVESFPEEKDEFFIEREFQEIQKQLEPKTDTHRNILPFHSGWLINVVGIAAAAVITVSGFWLWNRSAQNAYSYTSNVAFVETDIVGASSMIYMDEQSGWTLVWLDVPEDSTAEDIAG